MTKYLENLLRGSVMYLLSIAKKFFTLRRLEHLFTFFYETVFIFVIRFNRQTTRNLEEVEVRAAWCKNSKLKLISKFFSFFPFLPRVSWRAVVLPGVPHLTHLTQADPSRVRSLASWAKRQRTTAIPRARLPRRRRRSSPVRRRARTWRGTWSGSSGVSGVETKPPPLYRFGENVYRFFFLFFMRWSLLSQEEITVSSIQPGW